MGVHVQISVHVKKALAALIVPSTRLNLFSMLVQVSLGPDVYVCLHDGAGAGVVAVVGGLVAVVVELVVVGL